MSITELRPKLDILVAKRGRLKISTKPQNEILTVMKIVVNRYKCQTNRKLSLQPHRPLGAIYIHPIQKFKKQPTLLAASSPLVVKPHLQQKLHLNLLKTSHPTTRSVVRVIDSYNLCWVLKKHSWRVVVTKQDPACNSNNERIPISHFIVQRKQINTSRLQLPNINYDRMLEVARQVTVCMQVNSNACWHWKAYITPFVARINGFYTR